MRKKRVSLLLSTCLVILVSAYFIAPALLKAEEHTAVDESSDEHTSVDESSDEYTSVDESSDEYITVDEATDEYTTEDETTDEYATVDETTADEAIGEEVPQTGQTGNRVVISSTLLTLAASLFFIQRRKRELD